MGVEVGAAGEPLAGEGGEKGDNVAGVRVSGVQGREAGEKSPLPVGRGGEGCVGIV